MQTVKEIAIAEAPRALERLNIPFTVHNNGIHLVVGKLGRQVDYWPTTERFIVKGGGQSGVGFDEMLEALDQVNAPRRGITGLAAPADLNGDQRAAWAVLTGPQNVFLTGEAGTGKSHLIRALQARIQRGNLPMLAPTGVAALLIGGRTVHSFFGLGLFDGQVKMAVNRALGDHRTPARVQAVDGIIVDEVSMVSGPMLDAMEEIARRARHDDRPWGGLKVVVVGDFRQLPPVKRGRASTETPEWAFLSAAWHRSDFAPVMLKESMRTSDRAFFQFLNEIRRGHVSDAAADWLDSRVLPAGEEAGFEGTRLYGFNDQVDQVNVRALAALPGTERRILTEYSGHPKAIEGLKKNSPIGEEVVLKEDALVMIRKNDPEGRWVNGTLGFVRAMGYVEIKLELLTGEHVYVERTDFSAMGDNGEVIASAFNFPLTLAWATTIHKSQGCTLSNVLIDLRQLWDPGQAYVALSRAKTPDGIWLAGWDRRSIKSDRAVDIFHSKVFRPK